MHRVDMDMHLEIVINEYRKELDKRLMICFNSYTQNKLRELINDALKVMR